MDCRRRAGSEEAYIARQEEIRETERETQLAEVEAELTAKINKFEMDIEHEERVTAEVRVS